jgi:hypothetical protein
VSASIASLASTTVGYVSLLAAEPCFAVVGWRLTCRFPLGREIVGDGIDGRFDQDEDAGV